MTTSINVDQELGLIVAPGAPSVAEDQALAVIVEQRLVPQIISNYVDQQLALIVEQRIANLVQLTSGGYQDFLGDPLANGYLEIRIGPTSPSPAYIIGTEIVEGADLSFRISLDSSGNAVAGQYVYTTVATPTFTYTVTAYAADGTTASSPQTISIPNTSPYFNLSNIDPVFPPGNVG